MKIKPHKMILLIKIMQWSETLNCSVVEVRRVPASSLLVHVIAKTHSLRMYTRTINWIYSTNRLNDPALRKDLSLQT